jgi:small subunit ribosomal protein S6
VGYRQLRHRREAARGSVDVQRDVSGSAGRTSLNLSHIRRSHTDTKARSAIRTKSTDFEVTYILHPHLEEPEVAGHLRTIAEDITSRGGTIVSEPELLGKRRLAYEIDDVREGYYVTMRFQCELVQAKEVERRLRLDETVLRALVIRLDT